MVGRILRILPACVVLRSCPVARASGTRPIMIYVDFIENFSSRAKCCSRHIRLSGFSLSVGEWVGRRVLISAQHWGAISGRAPLFFFIFFIFADPNGGIPFEKKWHTGRCARLGCGGDWRVQTAARSHPRLCPAIRYPSTPLFTYISYFIFRFCWLAGAIPDANQY